MSTELVRTERRGHVLHVELNRPEKKNALTVEMYQALADAFVAAENDDEVRVILMTGTGDSFCAGNDLRDFLERPPTGIESPVHRFLAALVDASRPIVVAVQGHAVGIGTTMLLHADLVYAASDARFHLPFTSLGLVPEAGSSLLLPRRIGHARAAEMLLLGEPLGASDALDLGLVSGVFADGDLQASALARAERLATLPPEAVRSTKLLMREEYRTTVPDQMRLEAARFAERLRSEEARAVMRGFLEQGDGG